MTERRLRPLPRAPENAHPRDDALPSLRKLDRWRLMAVFALLVAAPLLARLYRENPSLGSVPETSSATFTADSIAREGNVDLQEFFPKAKPGIARSYAYRWHDGGYYSIEPLASSLTFAPFFLPYRGLAPRNLNPHALNNRVASFVGTFAVVLLGGWLLSFSTVRRALLVTSIVALATCYRTIVGPALWQHTSAAPWLIAGLFLWTAAHARKPLFLPSGACLAMATACRPILVPPAVLVVLDAWWALGLRRVVPWLTGAIVASIGGFALFANWHFHGSLLGGRAEIVSNITATHSVPSYFHFSMLNLLGLLLAPSRGLFVYSPVLLFAIPGIFRPFSTAIESPLGAPFRAITLSGLLVFLLYGFIATWWGGWVYGPRYMADLIPFFALWLALAPLPDRSRPVRATLFVGALAWSLAVQQIGVATYPCGWNDRPENIDFAPARLWDLRDTEIARCIEKLGKVRAGSALRAAAEPSRGSAKSPSSAPSP